MLVELILITLGQQYYQKPPLPVGYITDSGVETKSKFNKQAQERVILQRNVVVNERQK